MKRDFTNHANEAAGINYHIQKTYFEVLPQFGARYQLDTNNQLFFSLAKTMKVPPNFIFATTSNVKITNGVASLAVDVKPETSTNMDFGYRLQSDRLTAQATVYSVDFRDRQATALDVATNTVSLTSVGRVKTRGFELELGNTPVYGFSFYGSVGYAKSEIRDDLIVNVKDTLPTAGKQMTLTPEWKAGLSAMYETGAMYLRLKAKYTGEQWATMTNDELIPKYTVLGFDAGYQFPNTSWMKKPTLRFNISNLTNERYRNSSSFNITNAKTYGTAAGKTVFYYMGAPRFASVTLSADF